jgi:ATP-dependent Clp protease ATP-binding subunit ClpC
VVELLLTGILLGVALWGLGQWLYKRHSSESQRLENPADQAESPSDDVDRADGGDGKAARLLELAAELSPFFEQAARPADLLENPTFQKCVSYLNSAGFSEDELLDYYAGSRLDLACVVLEALSRRNRGRDIVKPLLQAINDVGYWTRYFALRCLDINLPAPRNTLIGEVLSVVNDSWTHSACQPFLREFITARTEAGEQPSFSHHLEMFEEERASFLLKLLPRLDESATEPLISELQAWLDRRIDFSFLDSVGLVWDESEEARYENITSHRHLEESIAQAEDGLLESPRRSVLLVGERGVGKSSIIGVLGRRLAKEGWTIFQAGHTELLAGQSYIGQLEERLQTLVRLIGGHRRVLWIIPDFHTLAMTGKHQYGPASALDYLLPYIESGQIAIVGEVTPSTYERLIQESPRCQTALEACRVNPLSEGETFDLSRRWAARFQHNDGTDLIPGEVIQEAWNLTTQYLWDKAAPGNLLQFLALTLQKLVAADLPEGRQMTVDDLLVTLSQLTGLPTSILDERESLDLDALRRLFHQRVMGQAEAVDCLVERVAMIKAGVTDPTRPQGVFLFAGPTGTGKTEIAKTLAEFLFGSPDRMIRLDMSEFQEPVSINRLLGDPENATGDALVDLIRNDPFSVVLLDEFEKASSPIWSIFLQVFDDGRLTDRWGRVADFRHAIIILTSNLGGAIHGGASLGFTQGSSKFSGRAVEMAVDKTFSKEFINRLDRIVIYRPLSRDVMRRILTKELEDVFRRRGLRNRAWAVEWDSSAIDFLLEKGFTVDLGARPLKRAVERYFLTPLASTIVKHQFPEGDQFLFVRRDDSRLVVEFIDPDAPEPDRGEVAETAPVEDLRVEDLILNSQGTAAELAFLDAEYRRLNELIESEDFKNLKRSALAEMASPKFWNSNDRFKVLGRAEYLDRIESGGQSARSLLERLTASGSGQRERLPRDLVGRLAQAIYLIRRACDDILDNLSGEAFLLVEADHPGNQFASRLGQMYKAWAEKRGMRLEVLEESGPDEKAYRLLLSVSGYAAYSILAPEDGLHFFEIPRDEGKKFKRWAVRVRVSPQPEQPVEDSPGQILTQAKEALESSSSEAPAVVRRYRESPSPLVRDSVRGWRTGRLERVLAGDFDLISGS